jgi:ribonuclease HI
MNTKIFLKGVRAYGYVGLLPEENVLGQWFEVDATLWVDFEPATYSDRLEDTYDYRTSIQVIENQIKTAKFALVERLAGAIADQLLENPKVEQVEIRVIKHPPIPNFLGSITVEVIRYKEGNSDQKKDLLNETPLPIPEKSLNKFSAVLPSTSRPSDKTSSKTITSIYTDGACSGNPGAGGWGAVVNFSDGSTQELGGRSAYTTNNQMEMAGAIAALEYVAQHPQSEIIPLYTDSKYVIDGISRWIKGWKQNGWRTKGKEEVKNREKWERIDELNNCNIKWEWVKGHSGNIGNERSDAIARRETANN